MMRALLLIVSLLPGLSAAASSENLAVRGTASQSSNYNHIMGRAGSAVDGNADPDFMQGSCSHTASQSDPWWRLELRSVASIAAVSITNRGDCCEQRIDGAQIRIGNSLSQHTRNTLAAVVDSIPAGHTSTFRFAPIEGRVVSIVLPGSRRILTLCEVQVFAASAPDAAGPDEEPTAVSVSADPTPDEEPTAVSVSADPTTDEEPTAVSVSADPTTGEELITQGTDVITPDAAGPDEEPTTITVSADPTTDGATASSAPPPVLELVNVAADASASQSSTFPGQLGYAQHAVDGNTDTHFLEGSCSHSTAESDPWWRADLQDTHRIHSVSITNRGDCCAERINGAQIRIGNSLRNHGNDNPLVATVVFIPSGATETFVFPPAEGRYVNIVLHGKKKILTLCEVQVFADLLRAKEA